MNTTKEKCYTAYGFSRNLARTAGVIGFNGMPHDNRSGGYHLGNGYRMYKPVIMRFSSADSLSPFGDGGMNAYGYCAGDPINRIDPDGASWWSLFGLGRRTQPEPPAPPAPLKGLPRVKVERAMSRSFDRMSKERDEAIIFTVATWDAAPHIFERIESHLGAHDLYVNKWSPGPVPDHLRARLKALRKHRYLQHQEAILLGRDPSYTGHLSDALLSEKKTKKLVRFDTTLRNAYLPFEERLAGRYMGEYERRLGLGEAIAQIRQVPSQKFLPKLTWGFRDRMIM